MIEVYREKDIVLIPRLQTLLEQSGIPTFTRNLSIAQVEVQIPEFYPALCLVNDADLSKAKQIVNDELERFNRTEIKDLVCPQCKEINPSSFDFCWNCSAELSSVTDQG